MVRSEHERKSLENPGHAPEHRQKSLTLEKLELYYNYYLVGQGLLGFLSDCAELRVHALPHYDDGGPQCAPCVAQYLLVPWMFE